MGPRCSRRARGQSPPARRISKGGIPRRSPRRVSTGVSPRVSAPQCLLDTAIRAGDLEFCRRRSDVVDSRPRTCSRGPRRFPPHGEKRPRHRRDDTTGSPPRSRQAPEWRRLQRGGRHSRADPRRLEHVVACLAQDGDQVRRDEGGLPDRSVPVTVKGQKETRSSRLTSSRCARPRRGASKPRRVFLSRPRTSAGNLAGVNYCRRRAGASSDEWAKAQPHPSRRNREQCTGRLRLRVPGEDPGKPPRSAPSRSSPRTVVPVGDQLGVRFGHAERDPDARNLIPTAFKLHGARSLSSPDRGFPRAYPSARSCTSCGRRVVGVGLRGASAPAVRPGDA